jgi:NAD(P)-dependent dehydrogenase (short-subunit alcohol dehydrogenase family)
MTKWTEADIPDQAGRTILITGANSGIGFEAARALAQHGATVVMGCRTRSKAETAVAEIEATDPRGSVEILEIDLSDLESIQSAADTFNASHDRLDVLVNNAGLMALPKQHTAQGFEMQIGVNHLGHFALTGHLCDLLLASGPSRVVTVSSLGHRPGTIKFDDLNSERSYSPWPAYFQSKLANLLFMRELQRRFETHDADTVAVAAHPGLSDTNLGRENAGGLLMRVMNLGRPLVMAVMAQNSAMGALPTLRAATDDDVVGGDYFGPDGFNEYKGHPKKVAMSAAAANSEHAARLWAMSEELTGVSYLD